MDGRWEGKVFLEGEVLGRNRNRKKFLPELEVGPRERRVLWSWFSSRTRTLREMDQVRDVV